MPLPRLKPPKIQKPKRPKAKGWVRLLEQIDRIPVPWSEGEIINLTGLKTVKYKETEHDIIIVAEVTTEIEGACACGETAANFISWGFTEPTYVYDMMIRDKRTRICYRLQRKRCDNSNCNKHKTLQQPVPGIDERHSLTTRLVEYIERESFSIIRSFSDIEDETGVHELIIRKIFTRRAKRLEDEALKLRMTDQYEPPEWLAIDEVYPTNKQAKLCVVSAPQYKQVIALLRVTKEKELFKWLLQLPKRHQVKVVTMDFANDYRPVVRRLLPQARIVIDRYHVHNLLNVALKNVLDVVRASMTYTENREHMRPEHLLLKSYRKLCKERKEDENGKEQPSEKEVVDKWLLDMPDVAQAHRLKEEFSDILQLTDRDKGEELTESWLQRVHKFVEYFRGKYQKIYPGPWWPDPFGNVPHTVNSWRDSILNYIDCKKMFNRGTVSNSFAEFANGRIKEAYDVGHYSFEVLRIKVVYGGVLVRRRPPHPLDVPRIRAVPRRDGSSLKEGGQKINPTSNLEVLKQAREAADETKGLLPQPQDNPGYTSRFSLAEIKEASRVTAAQEVLNKEPKTPSAAETAQPQAPNDGPNRRIKHDPDQFKLF